MAIHTFSTKEEDDEVVQRIKERCRKERIVFSRFIVDILREWEKRDDERRKV